MAYLPHIDRISLTHLTPHSVRRKIPKNNIIGFHNLIHSEHKKQNRVNLLFENDLKKHFTVTDNKKISISGLSSKCGKLKLLSQQQSLCGFRTLSTNSWIPEHIVYQSVPIQLPSLFLHFLQFPYGNYNK